MDIIIYGAGLYGEKLLNRIIDKYNDINVLAFADSNKTGMKNGVPIVDIFQNDVCYKKMPIVISIANFVEKQKVYKKLKLEGFQHIYYYLRKEVCNNGDFFKGECISVENASDNTLFYAEMSIIDFCNLNCKGCNHYSPIFERTYPDIDVRMSDIEKLKDLYDSVLEFGLIGGEPLLSPDIKEYIRRTRSLLPDTEIQMVTNGLLVPKLEEDVLRCIRDNKITIAISEYVPTIKIIDNIKNILEKNGIDYVIKPASSKEKFYKTLSLKNNSIYERKCISQGCVNLCDGKIAKCPTVLYIEELNRKFNCNFPTDGIYAIKSFKDGKELNAALDKRIPLCDYCINYQIKWEQCSKDRQLEDFVVFE